MFLLCSGLAFQRASTWSNVSEPALKFSAAQDFAKPAEAMREVKLPPISWLSCPCPGVVAGLEGGGLHQRRVDDNRTQAVLHPVGRDRRRSRNLVEHCRYGSRFLPGLGRE